MYRVEVATESGEGLQTLEGTNDVEEETSHSLSSLASDVVALINRAFDISYGSSPVNVAPRDNDLLDPGSDVAFFKKFVS